MGNLPINYDLCPLGPVRALSVEHHANFTIDIGLDSFHKNFLHSFELNHSTVTTNTIKIRKKYPTKRTSLMI